MYFHETVKQWQLQQEGALQAVNGMLAAAKGWHYMLEQQLTQLTGHLENARVALQHARQEVFQRTAQ